LLYGPTPTELQDQPGAGFSKKAAQKDDHAFAQWAELKLARLNKKDTERISKLYGDTGPEISNLLSENEGYESRPLVDFEAHQDYLFRLLCFSFLSF
jgi:hypothetical protein